MSQETGKQGALKAAQLWINQHFNDPAPIMLAALIEFTEYQLAEAQAARERAFEASNADLEKRRVAERQLARALETIQRLQNWVNDLQAGMYINCVYCGHHYGPKDEVPATMAEVLKQHIEQCPEHPCSKLKARIAELEQELTRAHDSDAWVERGLWEALLTNYAEMEAENARLRQAIQQVLHANWLRAMPNESEKILRAALAPAPPADALAAGYQANAEQAQAECAVWGGDARLEAMEAVCKAARNSHAQPQNVAMWNALGDALAALDREGTDATN